MVKQYGRIILAWGMVISAFGCTAGMPKPLPYPLVQQKPKTLKLIGVQEKRHTMAARSVTVIKEDGSLEQKGVDLPLEGAQFLDALERGNAATYYLLEGSTDYTVVVEKAYAKIGLARYFPLTLLFFPLPDKATGEFVLKVYDAKGLPIDTIAESGHAYYLSWFPLMIFHVEESVMKDLYSILQERAAVRTVEVLQKDTHLSLWKSYCGF